MVYTKQLVPSENFTKEMNKKVGTSSLVQTLRLAHGRLEVERLDVLPVLLEKGDKEVDSQHDVGNELILSHVHVTDCNAQAQNLLKLELDGGTELISLDGKVIVVGDGGRELANLVETGTEKTGDLLDESLRGNESIVLLGELLDELLVLVELLQILNRLELHTGSLGLVAVESITENADGHLGTGNIGKLDGTRETLVTLGIVVLETNLELDGLDKVTLLLLGVGEDNANGFSDGRNANLTTVSSKRGWSVYGYLFSVHGWMRHGMDGCVMGWIDTSW